MEGINEFYPSEADHVTTLGIGHTSAHTGSIGNEGATCRGSAFPTNSPSISLLDYTFVKERKSSSNDGLLQTPE